MHRQIAADAVTGAVVEVEPGLPQRRARQRVELGAAGALGKHRGGDGDVAFEHAGEAVAHFLAGVPTAMVRVMSVVPSSYCAPESTRNNSSMPMRRLDVAGDAVMHDGAVRPGAGDGRERDVLERAGVAAEAFQRLDRVDFGQLARRRFACRARRGSARSRRHRAVGARAPAISAWFFTAFISVIGSAPRCGLPPCLVSRLRESVGCARLVEPYGLVL